jgi:hypothetical protein
MPYRLQSEVGFSVRQLYQSSFKFHQVATIKYISENTNIPVNTVYAFDEDLDNAVGALYTLQKLVSVYATSMW